MFLKLLLNTKDFDNQLNKSTKNVEGFANKGLKGVGNFMGALGKIAGVAGIAAGGVDVLSKALKSSQGISDEVGRSMTSLQTVYDNFIYSVANADFTAWNQGFATMIRRAREAYDAYDQLNNTIMSAGYVQATSGAEYRTAMVGARDKSKTLDERRQSLDKARFEAKKLVEAQQAIQEDAVKALQTKLASKTGIDRSAISFDVISEALKIDATAQRAQQREQIEAAYDNYLALMKKIGQDKMKDAEITYGPGGTTSIQYNRQAIEEAARQEELALQTYADVIVKYNLLFRQGDEELAETIKTATSAVAAQNQIAEWNNSINEVENQLNNEAATIQKGAEKIRLANQELAAEREKVYGGAKGFDTSITPLASTLPAAPNGASDLPKSIEMIDTSVIESNGEAIKQRSANIAEGYKIMSNSVLDLVNAYSALNGAQNENLSKNMDIIASVVTLIESVLQTVSAIMAEAAARRANTVAIQAETAAKTAGAAAGATAATGATAAIPIIGGILSIIAAGIGLYSSIKATNEADVPKFAEGGIVTSATLGVFGEAGPEAVMPLDRLDDFVRDREVRVTGEIRAQGKDLVMIVDNYNKVRAVK